MRGLIVYISTVKPHVRHITKGTIMDNWLQCKLSPGQFEGEFGVDGEQHDGSAFSLFAPKASIKFDEEPTTEKASSGWVKVQVLQQREDLLLVRLPRETFQSGYFVTVK